MIRGTHIPPEDLTQTIFAVVRLARRHLTIISPVVEELVLRAIREHVREGVVIEVRSDDRGHARMAVADEHVALTTSTSFTVVGTGIGWVEPVEDEEPRRMNIEHGFLIEDPASLATLLGATRS